VREIAIAMVERPKTAVAAQGGALHLDGAVRGEHGGWRGGVSVWEEGRQGAGKGSGLHGRGLGTLGAGWGGETRSPHWQRRRSGGMEASSAGGGYRT